MIRIVLIALLVIILITNAIVISKNNFVKSEKMEDVKIAYVRSILEVLGRCRIASNNESATAKIN